MKRLTPALIEKITGGEYIGDEGDRNAAISGAAKDNREVVRGNLFICIQGTRVDGHLFANDAFQAGAACCLAERTIHDAKGPYILVESTLEAIKKIAGYYRTLFDIPVIGITGSVGKTTTKEMVASVLAMKHKVNKTQGNMNNELGVPLTLLSLDESHEAAVIEMGISNFGEMNRLAEMVKPDICIITKIGYSHIETLCDLNGVLKAKGEIFSHMNPQCIALLNGDDEMLRDYEPGMRKVTYGQNEGNDYRAMNIRVIGMDKVEFDIVSGFGKFRASVNSYGSHLVYAALAAAALGKLLGMTDSSITAGLASYKPTSGRAHVVDTGYIRIVDDCYNANPNSVEAALTSLSVMPARRVAVLGDMLELGDKSGSMHWDIGVFAAKSKIDSLICCGKMAEHIYKGFTSISKSTACFYPDLQKLSEALPSLAKKGDTILVKASHGMEFERLIPLLGRLPK